LISYVAHRFSFMLDALSTFAANTPPTIESKTQLHLLYEDDMSFVSDDQIMLAAAAGGQGLVDFVTGQRQSLERSWPLWMRTFDEIFSQPGMLVPAGYPWTFDHSTLVRGIKTPKGEVLEKSFLPEGYEHLTRIAFLLRRIIRNGPNQLLDPSSGVTAAMARLVAAGPAAGSSAIVAASAAATMSVQSIIDLHSEDVSRITSTPLESIYAWYAELPPVSHPSSDSSSHPSD
jgi:hypothetical protein